MSIFIPVGVALLAWSSPLSPSNVIANNAFAPGPPYISAVEEDVEYEIDLATKIILDGRDIVIEEFERTPCVLIEMTVTGKHVDKIKAVSLV